MPSLSQEQKEDILSKKAQGLSIREIARQVLEQESRESTIRRFLKSVEGESVGFVEEDLEDFLEDVSHLVEDENVTIKSISRKLRNAQKANSELRKVNKSLLDGCEESIEDVVNKAWESLKGHKVQTIQYKPELTVQGSTLEVLLSDVQMGKVSRYYNTKTALLGLELYGQEILKSIKEKENKFRIERIVFAMLGDIAEDHMKHGVGSAIATDSSSAEQMHNAIEGIFKSLLEPLALLKIPMDVMCIVGNHNSSTHKGMGSFKEGIYSYDYVVHKTLESFCRISKFDWVTFSIPEGTFGHLEIYGKHAIYEHGYHSKCSEEGMIAQMRKRGAQLEVHPTYWRQGDRHHSAIFGMGEQVLNGALFGIDKEGIEYSGILGFNSIPSQTIMYHVDDKRIGYSNVKDIIPIQVAIV